MKIQFNEDSMNKVALFKNSIVIIEHFGRFLVAKEYKGIYRVFFNTSSFDQSINYGQKM